MSSTPVLVTGGSGFLGSWCIKALLDKGYTVRTTVRSADKASFLREISGADTRLTIFPGVDLLTDGSYEEAMRGCEVVLHTASPFYVAGGTEDKLVTPAVEGTRNVLASCSKLGVKKVVLTASMASVYVNYGALPADHVYTDRDWSDETLMREKCNWYCLSKTLAERLAWDMSREASCPYELAVMNPTLILGPQLPGQPHLNTSSAFIVNFMDGSMKEVDNVCRALVDVRDVAAAHVAAFETQGAMGRRYVLISSSPHCADIADSVRRALPESLKSNVASVISSTIPPTVMGNPPPSPILFDSTPSQELLGVKYFTVDEMIATTVSTCLENGFNHRDFYVPEKL